MACEDRAISGQGGQSEKFTAIMKLISPDFSEGGNIPERFTCDGEDISPTFRHIHPLARVEPAAGRHRDRGERLAFRRGARSERLGRRKYGGPCPPSGVHRYYFKLYALDTALQLPAKSKRKVVDAAIEGHIISEAALMGRYARKGTHS